MTQAATPVLGPAAEDSRHAPDFVFATPKAPPRPDAAAAAPSPAPAQRRRDLRPALRFAAVAAAIGLLLGAWYLWRENSPADTAHAPATVHSATPAAQAASAAAPSPLMTRLDAAFAAIKDNAQALQAVLEGQKSQQATLDKLERDVAELTENFRQLQARQTAAAASAPRPRPRLAKAAPPAAPKAQAQLLSVDVWDGRPSAVVGTADPADKRVVYLHEGDQSKGITLKRADPVGQRAVFDVAGQDVVLTRDATR
jgi:hypothetical protein